jgi:serine/threonine-protein kinase
MIGSTIAHFRVLSLLGEGAMGKVYAAEDTDLGRRVALKVLADAGAAAADHAQLVAEARVAASLDHVAIAQVHEVGEDQDGRIYIAMELIEGPTLADVLADGPLPPARACRLLDALAAGMAHAHERGVIHRDLKPANIMLTADGEPKIMDFGLALQRSTDGAFDPEAFGGTLAYLAPELISGADPDELADIWSLGVIAHEMLTGRRPFSGEYTAALLYAISHGTVTPVGDIVPEAAFLQEPLLDRLLARDREARFASMAEVRRTLQDLAVAPKARRRRPLALDGVAAVLAVAAIVVWMGSRIWPERDLVPDVAASVAVMPLTIAPSDSSLRDFASGFSGEVIAELAQVADLRVIAQSSTRQLAGQSLSPAEIADRLGVETVVEGTVRLAGENLRISAKLRDTRRDRVLWAESYDAQPGNVLILQASVARAVAATLKGELDEDEAQRLTETATIDPEAYRAYLRAVAKRARWGSLPNWFETEELLLTTVTREPDFAPAWSELGRVYHFLSWFIASDEALAERFRHLPDGVRLAMEHKTAIAERLDLAPESTYDELAHATVAHALDLDPELGPAHAVHGMVLAGEHDWNAARAAFERAVELAPGDEYVRRWYANFLQFDGQCDEAQRQARIGVAQSPLAMDNKREMMAVLYNCGLLEEADRYTDEILPIYTQHDVYLIWFHKMLIAIARNDVGRAQAMADSLQSRGLAAYAAPARWQAGQHDAAWDLIGGRVSARVPEIALYLHVFEDQPDRALDIIERWADAQPQFCLVSMADPMLAPLHEHPRWVAVAERFELPGYR